MKPIRSLLLLAAALAAVGVSACSWFSGASWKPPQVVRIQSDKDVSALTPSWVMWRAVSEKGAPQGLLLRDGDYFLGDETFVRYRASDGPALTVTSEDDWNVKLGGAIVTVMADKEEGAAWLTNAADQQLKELRTISIAGDLEPAALPALKRLAAVNPGIDVFAESSGTLAQVLPLFRPRTVLGPDEPDAGARDALANQPQIERLFIGATEPGSLAYLAKLKNLRTLMLLKWDVAAAGSLPADLPALTSLMIVDVDGLTDLKPLGPAATGLEELSLIALDHFGDLSGIEKMTSLRTLILLSGEEFKDLSSLNSLKELRWVALPPKTSQEQFASFVAAHPKLEILDMIGNKTVADLAPIATLKNLHGLVLDGPFGNLAPIQTMTSLRFVGISKKILEDKPGEAEAIRKALPDALVVTVAPFCLGSGWILLLLPVPVLAWGIRRWRASRLARTA
jgi:hypothetical protein